MHNYSLPEFWGTWFSGYSTKCEKKERSSFWSLFSRSRSTNFVSSTFHFQLVHKAWKLVDDETPVDSPGQHCTGNSSTDLQMGAVGLVYSAVDRLQCSATGPSPSEQKSFARMHASAIGFMSFPAHVCTCRLSNQFGNEKSILSQRSLPFSADNLPLPGWLGSTTSTSNRVVGLAKAVHKAPCGEVFVSSTSRH